jgi:hypothetical protein
MADAIKLGATVMLTDDGRRAFQNRAADIGTVTDLSRDGAYARVIWFGRTTTEQLSTMWLVPVSMSVALQDLGGRIKRFHRPYRADAVNRGRRRSE